MAIRIDDNTVIVSCPKCGSQSLRALFNAEREGEVLHDRNLEGVKPTDRVLATARNPWSRAVSGYLWDRVLFQRPTNRDRGDYPPEFSLSWSFRQWVDWYIDSDVGRQWMQRQPWGWIGCGYSMTWWYGPLMSRIDGWIRLEHMAEDLEGLGITRPAAGPIPHINANPDKRINEWRTFYDQETQQIIAAHDDWFFQELYADQVQLTPTHHGRVETYLREMGCLT